MSRVVVSWDTTIVHLCILQMDSIEQAAKVAFRNQEAEANREEKE